MHFCSRYWAENCVLTYFGCFCKVSGRKTPLCMYLSSLMHRSDSQIQITWSMSVYPRRSNFKNPKRSSKKKSISIWKLDPIFGLRASRAKLKLYIIEIVVFIFQHNFDIKIVFCKLQYQFQFEISSQNFLARCARKIEIVFNWNYNEFVFCYNFNPTS